MFQRTFAHICWEDIHKIIIIQPEQTSCIDNKATNWVIWDFLVRASFFLSSLLLFVKLFSASYDSLVWTSCFEEQKKIKTKIAGEGKLLKIKGSAFFVHIIFCLCNRGSFTESLVILVLVFLNDVIVDTEDKTFHFYLQKYQTTSKKLVFDICRLLLTIIRSRLLEP